MRWVRPLASQSKIQTFGVLGAGVYGMPLGGVLTSNGHEVNYYDPKIEGSNLKDVVERAQLVMVCTPSEVVPSLLPEIPKNKSLIVATKGFLLEKPFNEFEDWMVISGPGYADDIKAGKPTHLTATDPRVVEMFATEYLTFDMTSDKRGVLMCGALKNVYAILAGILKLSPESPGYVDRLDEFVTEMRVLLSANNAEPETVDLACGKADLRLTCYYPSRNYEFGRQLAEDTTTRPVKTVEGLTALRRIKSGEITVPENLPYLRKLLNECESWGCWKR